MWQRCLFVHALQMPIRICRPKLSGKCHHLQIFTCPSDLTCSDLNIKSTIMGISSVVYLSYKCVPSCVHDSAAIGLYRSRIA